MVITINFMTNLDSKTGRELLIIFTRYPVPGQTKTRLIPALGEEQAAKLQRLMSEHTFSLGLAFSAERDVDVEVYYWSDEHDKVRKWVPEKITCRCQSEGGLGERLHHAFTENLQTKAGKVVVIGADCPFLNTEILNQAFDALTTKDVVLGPAYDGGCYLIGLKQTMGLLWNNIDWGTETVLQQLIANGTDAGLSVILLQPLADIDRPEDIGNLLSLRKFHHWEEAQNQ